jgi:hypothetical protein
MGTATTERATEHRASTGHYRAYVPRPFTRAERDSVTILFGGLLWRVERVPVQQTVERSGTLFFSFQDLDSTKPAGSVKIRVETITHYLERYASDIIERKQVTMGPPCPLLPRADRILAP